MYSDDDLNAAVSAGVLTQEAATGFQRFVAGRRNMSPADEERFRLLLGFNDIFVGIAVAIVVVAVGWLGGAVAPAFGGAAVAAVSWGLAEFFTRRRRQALPSILLLLSFVAGMFVASAGLLIDTADLDGTHPPLGAFAIAAAVTGLAAYAHWRRFMVPITVAAGLCVALAAVIATLMVAVPGSELLIPTYTLMAGLILFAAAMAWDAGDRQRTTRRSDVAFWLHLAAAPAIIHPIFTSVGMLDQGGGSLIGVLVTIGVYLVIALVSLAIDRRAMLVSALSYVLYALTVLFQAVGTTDVTTALAALVIGSALLLLSAGWQGARRIVLNSLPMGMRGLLPAA